MRCLGVESYMKAFSIVVNDSAQTQFHRSGFFCGSYFFLPLGTFWRGRRRRWTYFLPSTGNETRPICFVPRHPCGGDLVAGPLPAACRTQRKTLARRHRSSAFASPSPALVTLRPFTEIILATRRALRFRLTQHPSSNTLLSIRRAIALVDTRYPHSSARRSRL